jgi:hypothetical protein
MRVMAFAIVSMLAVFAADGQAFAAKRSTGNPDRNSYQSAAGSCGGSAFCYRSGSHSKKH